ncbi:beta subunit of fatty acid synthetase [Xylographa bjoerkii]|nr:beta subunit of fatty acid synthetase [Xylographa bjoerkii]
MSSQHSDHEDFSTPPVSSSIAVSTSSSSRGEVMLEGIDYSSLECPLKLTYQDLSWDLQVFPGERSLLQSVLDNFLTYLGQRDAAESSALDIPSDIVLASVFLDYLLQSSAPTSAIRLVFREFERNYLTGIDIHNLAIGLESSHCIFLLQTYHATLQATNQSVKPAQSGILREAEIGNAKIYAVFGGQGFINRHCFEELCELRSIYGGLTEELLDVAARTLNRLATLADTVEFFEGYGYNIRTWFENPDTVPPKDHIATAPYSFPLIGLISLAHYCITCKTLGKSPGEMRLSLRGLTGHSQGIIAAAAVARAISWESFYESAQMAVEMLFWIGYESHCNMSTSSLPAAVLNDSVEAGEGQLSSMLSITGLDHRSIHQLIEETNAHLRDHEQVYLALVNSRDRVVVGGPPKSLRVLNLRVRKIKAAKDLNHSGNLSNQSESAIMNQFLPISAAFHTPYLENVIDRILNVIKHWHFTGDDIGIPLFHTKTGEDLRTWGSRDIIESLVRMITVELVDWPKLCQTFRGSHLLDFGPGRVSALDGELTDGTGVRVILASQISPASEKFGGKSELFSSITPPRASGVIHRPLLARTRTEG